MIYRLPYPIAIPLQHVATFAAADPWNGNVRAEWTLRVFRMTGENNRALYAKYSQEKRAESATGQNLDREDVLGIESSVDSLFHILPIALVRLWQQGRVPNEALPALIAQVDGSLERRDFYDPTLGRSWRRYLLYGIAGLGTLFIALGFWSLIAASRMGVSGTTGLLLWGVMGLFYWLIAGGLLLWMRRREARVAALEQRLAAALPALSNASV